MLGSILSNILLVLGCCFIAGGIKYKEQSFNTTVASTMSSLLSVSTASLIIPAALYASLQKHSEESPEHNILILSHGTAIILLFIYVMYLVFQLKTHSHFFEENTGEEAEAELLTPWAAGVLLVIITIAVAVCAEYLVDSIDSIVETAHISKTFIGLILIPIVGNAAEHVTAVVVAYKDKMDLAIGVAIGSSLQIALFVTPFLVVLGWIMDRNMTLHFETFETVAFFLAALVVTLLIQDGKSNYLEGVLCIVSCRPRPALSLRLRTNHQSYLHIANPVVVGNVCNNRSRLLRLPRQSRPSQPFQPGPYLICTPFGPCYGVYKGANVFPFLPCFV